MHDSSFNGKSSSSRRGEVLPAALGNPQDLGGWRSASGPGEVISDALELLVVDGDLRVSTPVRGHVLAARACRSRAGNYILTYAPPSTTR